MLRVLNKLGSGAVTVLLSLGIMTCRAGGQDTYKPIPGTDQVSIAFPAGRQIISTPMKLIADVPTIQVQVQGRPGKHVFVIDTGASYTLMDTAVAKGLGLAASDKGHISGAGSGRIAVDLISGVNFNIAGLRSSGHKVVITDLSGIAEILGVPIAGILGYDFLSKLAFTLDYHGNKALFEPSGAPTPSAESEIVAVRFKRRWPYIPMTVKVFGHAELSDDFLVDTGSADEVNHPLIKDSSQPTRRTKAGVGLGTATQGVTGTLEYAQLGSFRIEGVASSCCASNPDTHRQVGSGFLKNFIVTFDYGSHCLFVRKAK